MTSIRRFLPSIVFLTLLPAGLAAQIAATGSPHGRLKEGLTCTTCHTAEGWTVSHKNGKFNHAKEAGFALSGRHRELDCRQCHLDLKWSEPKLPADACSSCHLDIHRGNLSPNCRSCHTTESFAEVPGVAVHAQTSFPLTGAHLQVTCETCHTENQAGAFFGILDSECIACHEEDYANTQLVDHVATGFPTDCQQCHETLTWTGGTVFDHISVSTGFALVGAHDGMRCASCHIPPSGDLVFSTSDQNDCIACHQADYDREHPGSGFPTDCLACHTDDTFSGANFADHDTRFFPVTSGKHAGKWNNDCTICHAVPSDFTVHTCFNCHEHNQSKSDDQHKDVADYTYQSAECLRCHPDGRS
jgi:hypothetical protein